MLRLRGHKYGAKSCVVDGIRFASQKEAKRYGELKLLEKAGAIYGLTLQCRIDIAAPVLGHPYTTRVIGAYIADFKYFDSQTQQYVLEDVKGFKTPLYKWKRRHVEAQYGITIREI